MRLLFSLAAIISLARCTIDDRPEDKNYVDAVAEEQGFDDLTVEQEPIDQEDFSETALLPSPSFTPTSTTASPFDFPSVSSQLLMSSPDSLPTSTPLLEPPATSTMVPDLSVTIIPTIRFMPNHPESTISPLEDLPESASPQVLISPPDEPESTISPPNDVPESASPQVLIPPPDEPESTISPLDDVPESASPQVLIPPPDELPEDVTETSPPTTTTSRPSYTILTVAIVPPIGDMSNIMDNTQKERVNYTFDGMTTQAPPRPRFKTTLIDEVVTFRPPTDPPVFATLLHSVSTSTRRPRIVKLNDGEVKHRSSGKVKKTNFFPRQKTRGHKRKLEKAVKRLRGNRKLVSRDVGPVGRRVPIPRGWKVTNIRRL